MNNIDPVLIESAKKIILKYNNASLSLIQVHLKLNEQDAAKIMQYLTNINFISDYTKPPVFINRNLSLHTTNQKQHNPENLSVFYDNLDGHEFEYFCADILKYNGYSQIQVTSASGDYGVDILCKKNNKSYAIQCKCYNGSVGNHAVQEVVSGKLYYNCDYAIVLTNSTFTHAAEETARLTNAELWDRSILNSMYKTALNAGYIPSKKW